MNKRGQFFLITAGILAVIIVGLATSVNYAITSPEPEVFYDLNDNFNLETLKVMDYGTLSMGDPNAISSFIFNFTKYAREKDPNFEGIFIFGNSQSFSVYNSASEPIKVCNPQTNQCTSVIGGKSTSDINLDGIGGTGVIQQTDSTKKFDNINKITIVIGKNDYEFVIPANNQFYFILRTEKEGETYVAA